MMENQLFDSNVLVHSYRFTFNIKDGTNDPDKCFIDTVHGAYLAMGIDFPVVAAHTAYGVQSIDDTTYTHDGSIMLYALASNKIEPHASITFSYTLDTGNMTIVCSNALEKCKNILSSAYLNSALTWGATSIGARIHTAVRADSMLFSLAPREIDGVLDFEGSKFDLKIFLGKNNISSITTYHAANNENPAVLLPWFLSIQPEKLTQKAGEIIDAQ